MSTRNARQIIEQVIRDEDPFNVRKWQAAQIVAGILYEAWSPEKRAEVIARAGMEGYELTDSIVIGDFDLVLWKTKKIEGYALAYVVSINNAEHDPLDKEAQKEKFPGQPPPITKIKSKVEEWVNRYGTLVIGSYIPKRNRLYLRLFQRMMGDAYHFEPFYGSFNHGFLISRK